MTGALFLLNICYQSFYIEFWITMTVAQTKSCVNGALFYIPDFSVIEIITPLIKEYCLDATLIIVIYCANYTDKLLHCGLIKLVFVDRDD